MHKPTPEETRRHIHFKVSCRQLDPLVADRMLRLFDEDQTLPYHQLHRRALDRPLPDVAFHTAPSHLMLAILEHGLRVSDPARGHHGQHAHDQDVAVYMSDVDEAMRGRYAVTLPSDVWRIEGLESLSPAWRRDRLNPTCWAVLEPIPSRLLSLHYTIR